MISPLVVAMPGNESFATALAEKLSAPIGQMRVRSFPDAETYLQFETQIANKSVILVCTMDRPDPKFLPLVFAADTARELGAATIVLVAPYLCYMRQDERFRAGEAVTSTSFARLISAAFDCLITVDPHLHRHHSLGEIYSIPTRVGRSAVPIADWIGHNEEHPLLIGPDIESEQWVAEAARRIGAPYVVLRKERLGDREVRVAMPDLREFKEHTPVLIDDIVSSGRTMIEAARQLGKQGLRPPTCIAVHALLSADACRSLEQVSSKLVSTNTVRHESNRIDVSGIISESLTMPMNTTPQTQVL